MANPENSTSLPAGRLYMQGRRNEFEGGGGGAKHWKVLRCEVYTVKKLKFEKGGGA